MAFIEISRGKQVIVDDDMFDELNNHKWYCVPNKDNTNFYAVRNITVGIKKQKRIWMHRQIFGNVDAKDVDHINNNGLDNRKENLRQASRSQNNCNSFGHNNASSKYNGVCWDKIHNKWRAQITIDKRCHYIGRFVSEESAAMAYDKAAVKSFGEFARTNTYSQESAG